MEASTNILNELRAISPALAALEKVNPFTVPDGYFGTVSDEILALAFREQHAAAVPEGYFNALAGNILNKIKANEEQDASKELRALSPLLYSIQSNDNLFTVPKNYFKDLPGEMLVKINEESAADEIAHLSPLLAGIQQKNVFTVPQGYFDSFFAGIEDKFTAQPAKIVSMGSRSRTFFKYAVAAVFTGVMALTVFKFTGTGTKSPKMPDYATAGLKIKPANVDKELASLSNDDIADYLQDNGEGIDAKTLASAAADEKSLPTEFDYLSDDKALDNFLNNVTAADLKN